MFVRRSVLAQQAIVALALLIGLALAAQQDTWEQLNARFQELYSQGNYAEAGAVAEAALRHAEATLHALEERHKDLKAPEEVQLSEILVKIPVVEGATPTAEQVSTAEAKARRLLETIRNGARFDEVARKSSDAATAAEGGDIGSFKRGLLTRELEEAAFGLKPGEVSEVIRTRQGFILLQVTEYRVPGMPPRKEVESRLATSLNNLAELYHGQGRYAQAEPLLKRSLAISEKALGPDHPDVATSLENYAAQLRKMHRDAEAEKLEARAREIRAKHR